MNASFRIDVHEPVKVARLIQQVVPDAVYPSTNNPDYSDYVWEDCDGETVEWERKTWPELLGDLDSVEYQLRVENQRRKSRLGLLVEGVATPSVQGTTVWRQSAKGDVFYHVRDQFKSIKMVYAWLHQVAKYVEVQYSSSQDSTAMALVAFYEGDQKPEHKTFRRHLNTMDWHPNPQVMMLMGIGAAGSKAQKLGIGPAKAEELIRRYGTVWNIVSADPKELRGTGLGIGTVQKLLRKVGRPDV